MTPGDAAVSVCMSAGKVIAQQADRIAELEARVKELDAERESLIDSGIDKIMAASDEQINALCRQEGHDPDDEAKLAKYACEMAILKHKLTASRAQVERLVDVLTRAERKLSAYVGVCTGDKELTNTILPMVHEALAAVEKERT